MRRRLAAAIPLVWALGLVLVSHSPALAVVPALGVLRGPLGVTLLAVAAAMAVAARRADGREGPEGPRGFHVSAVARALDRKAVLFVAGFVLLAGVGLAYTTRLRVSGDEPHYLIMAQSLWREGDLDLTDNYGRGDFLEYTPGPVEPHYGAPRRDGRAFPAHSPGLPFVLAPVYAAAGRAGCVILLAVMASALALEARRLAIAHGAGAGAALLAWLASLGPPVFYYSFHVYTEVPSALALAASLRLVLGPLTVAGAIGAALLASALPWLHLKMVPAAAALAVVALVRGSGRSRTAFAATAAVMAVGFAAYYQSIFGRPSPLAIYGGVPADANGHPLGAALGLLLDRSFGLLPHAPVWLLAAPGLLLLRRRSWSSSWPLVLVGAAVVAPLLSWRMWWGGQCPPARFLVPLVPILAVAVAARADGPPRGLSRWRVTLLSLGYVAALFASADPGRLLLLNRGSRPTRLWAALSGSTPVERYLPSLTLPDAAEWRVAALWVAVLAVLLTLDRLAESRERVDRFFRGLGLPVVLLLSLGVLVDGWARRGPPAVSSPPPPTVVVEPVPEARETP